MEQATTQEVKKTTSTKPKEGFKRVLKGQKEVFHDLYKLSISKYKRNDSWKFYKPTIVEVDHLHWYHSIDRKGTPNNKTSDMSGHFHYVETINDGKGNITLKCSAPMRTVIKKRRGKEETVIEPVFYGAKSMNEINEDGERVIPIVDEHTHEFEYVNSEGLKF